MVAHEAVADRTADTDRTDDLVAVLVDLVAAHQEGYDLDGILMGVLNLEEDSYLVAFLAVADDLDDLGGKDSS